ncbi:helicase-associated domain-containing protein [Leucobacter sp. GX24907]
MTNGALPLATSIAALDRPGLASLVRARLLRAVEGVQDPLTLALELLRGDSISRVLSVREVSELAALIRLDGDANASADQSSSPATCATAEDPTILTLIELGLVGRDDSGNPTPLPEVTAALEAALASVGLSRDALTHAPLPRRSSEPGGASAATACTENPTSPDSPGAPAAPWYGAALTTVARAAAILRALSQRPGKVNRRGTIAVAFVRGIAEQYGIDPAAVQRCLRTLECAKLTTTVPTDASGGGSLVITSSGTAWLDLPHPDRWAILAEARISALGAQFFQSLSEMPDDATAAAEQLLPSRYPLLPQGAREAAIEAAEACEDLGLTVNHSLTAAARVGLCEMQDPGARRDTLAASAAEHMPAAVDSVYLQPDLSVIEPGPLRPGDEHLLTSVSEPEQLGVASTLRITPEALARTVDAGTSPEDLRRELERLSVTGVPQPLAFLIDELSRRDSILVSPHTGDEGRTLVETTRAETAEMLRVDRALQHLQLQPAVDAVESTLGEGQPYRLFSRLSTEHVLTALVDARYPATRRPEATGTQQVSDSALISGSAPSTAAANPGNNFSAAVAPAGAGRPEITEQVERTRQAAQAARAGQAAQTGKTGQLERAGHHDTPSSDAVDATATASSSHNESDDFDVLIDRVFEAARSEPGEADMTRRLDLAIRDRARVRIIAEARGREYEFLMLPVSMSGGRLRASDEAAGVERTLPLSAIVAVSPA